MINMKNIMKQFIPLLAVFVMVMMAGCNNMMSPPKANKNLSNGLQISVSGGDTGKRTLFPNANFVEYELTFDYQDASETHAPVTLPGTAPSTLVTGLADGDWTITAVGMVEIDGVQYAAAEGSETITVDSGSFQSLAIGISPNQTGADGFFTYSVSFPENVELADLYLEEYGGGWYGSYDLLVSSQDSILVPPGYYIMSVYMETEDTQKGCSEVVHIYSNMETCVAYEFTEDDFAKFITLSGTVDIFNNANNLSWMEIEFYNDEDFYDYAGYYFSVDLIENTWSVKIPAFDQNLTFYLYAHGWDITSSWFDANAGSITVKDSSQSGILLNVYFSITLSGTVSFGETANWMDVNVYRDADFDYHLNSTSADTGDGNKWSISILPFTTDTTLYFWVYGQDINNDWFEGEAGSITVKNTDIDNIELALSTITLSGVLSIVEGDDTYSYLDINFGTEKYSWNVGYTEVDDQDGSFSFSSQEYKQNTTLYVSAYIEFDDGICMAELGTINVKDTDISGLNYTLDLNQLNTISGTVTYDTPLNWMDINIYLDPDMNIWIGDTYVDTTDNTWSTKIPSFAQNTTLYFSVEGEDINSKRFVGEAGSVTVRNTDKENIELIPGALHSGDYITLSGTIDTSISASSMRVFANTYDDQWNGDVNSDDTWSVQVPKFSGKKAIEFWVEYNDGYWQWEFTGKRIIVTGNDVSGIVLKF